MHSYSCEGYRTLVIGMKRLTQTEVEEFLIKQAEIQATSENLESDLAMLYSQMETELKYLGCTAIEDKLQEGVPDTIANLIEANIRFWVLTGDKLVSLHSLILNRRLHLRSQSPVASLSVTLSSQFSLPSLRTPLTPALSDSY